MARGKRGGRESRVTHAIAALRGLSRREAKPPAPSPDPEPPQQERAAAPPHDDRLEALRAEARYHRERHELYLARSYGMRPTSPARLRELERARAQAEERLARAEREPRDGPGDRTPPEDC